VAIIGISCDNDNISYVVIDGTANSPKVLDCETYPLKQIEKGELLDSANHRIETLIKKHQITKAAILVVDKIIGSTKTHPVKHQIEGVIIYKFFKERIPCIEYSRNKKLTTDFKNKLNISIDLKPSKIDKFIEERFSELCKKDVTNKNQREAFAIALTQL